jgi:hypothetical protein
MSVREALQRSKTAGITTAVVLFTIAGSMIAYTVWPHGPRANPTGAFLSDDDGQSFYSDSIYHFPPYEHEGKTAYRAIVYSSNSGKFVGILARFTPDTKKLLEDEYAKASRGDEPMYMVLNLLSSPQVRYGMEYKLPGGGHQWSRNSPAVKASDGGICYMVNP